MSALALAALGSACATASPSRGLEPGKHAYADSIQRVKPVQIKVDGMALATIDAYLAQRTAEVRTPRPGVWHLSVDGVMILMIAEKQRVRIVAPIFSLKQLDHAPAVKSALMIRLLQANFERAVDARYAIFDEMVFASVTHPRETLQVRDLDRFITQVVNLHKNTFRSGERGYSAHPPEPDSEEIDPLKDRSLLPRHGDDDDDTDRSERKRNDVMFM